MNQNKKISYYSLEDLENIGIVDNIKCNEKSFLGIFVKLLPFLLILAIINIIPIPTIISHILFISLSVIIFILLFRIHAYDRFINFTLSINNKEILYKNEIGQVYYYKENDILSAKYHRRYSRHFLTDKIELNMSDKQTIWINESDRHFYKLITYLEQKELFKKL